MWVFEPNDRVTNQLFCVEISSFGWHVEKKEDGFYVIRRIGKLAIERCMRFKLDASAVQILLAVWDAFT